MTALEQAAYRELSDRLTALAALAITLASGCRDADGRTIGAETILRERLLHELITFWHWSGVCPPSSSSEPPELPPVKR